ncbi:GNAT family acetyltransferase [Geobacillus stearothermophilus]|nr:GNAT family acetyltransferase [Geobacillus stearothermophilus]
MELEPVRTPDGKEEVVIRLADPDEAHLIHQITMAAFAEYEHDRVPSAALNETVEFIRERLEDGDEQALLCIQSGRPIVVRTASPEDAERVVAFVKAVAAEAPYLLTTEAEMAVTSEQQKQWLQQMADDSGKLALLAEHDSEMIGFLDFHNGNKRRTKHQGSFGMSVKKDFRGQGVGTALLAALLDWAKENPLIEKVCLEVVAGNKNAIRLYQKFGFVEEGVKKKAAKIDDGTYWDLILMARFVK